MKIVFNMKTCGFFLQTNTLKPCTFRPNIYLSYERHHPAQLVDAMQWYLDELTEKGAQAPKCLVFCRYIGYNTNYKMYIKEIYMGDMFGMPK